MQTNSIDAIISRRYTQARRKRFSGALFILVAFGGLANVWADHHTLFTYSTVWAMGLAIVSIGFLSDAHYIFRTNKEPKGYLTLLGQLVLCIGMAGPLLNKWTRSHDAIWLWALFIPLLLAAAGLIIVGFWFAVKAAPLWFGKLFSRER